MTDTLPSSVNQHLFGLPYQAPPGVYDELYGLGGKLPQASWMKLVESLNDMGQDDFVRRWKNGLRLIQQNGVTYNVYGDIGGLYRPWKLDPFPVIFNDSEWSQLSSALVQRASLLEAILKDLYTDQNLLTSGAIPLELIFAQPGFLRPCHNLQPSDGRYLHVYAADIARSPDGSWWVISDRTQAPSGAGYALENRIVLSRMLPDTFRRAHVMRLAETFQSFHETLRRMAPQNKDNPTIALLTPGPWNETYFEHAYLARYLGLMLVEGGDLTVRDNKVYMKTLRGLVQIDVIWRRLDDSYCDPLWLRDDSMLGVPGLVQAARAGNVAIANPLGSGLVESPALMGFLPNLCRQILGESLKMPSVATWWCGEANAREYVLNHLDEVVIKGLYYQPGHTASFGQGMTKDQMSTLRHHIAKRPEQYLGQEVVRMSSSPCWINDRIEPRHVMCRIFLYATQDGFTVMPGALTRVARSHDSVIVSMQQGGGSKDTWVLGDESTAQSSLLPQPDDKITLHRGGFYLPSRLADNLFWLGRYMERATFQIRVLREMLECMTDKQTMELSPIMPALYRVADQYDLVGRSEETSTELPAFEELEQQLLRAAFDPKHPTGLRLTLDALHHVGFSVRDRISNDSWLMLARLREALPEAGSIDKLDVNDALGMFDHLMISLAAFMGLGMESMTRDMGWRFMDTGLRLERVISVLTVFRELLCEDVTDERAAIETTLRLSDSLMTYRARYYVRMQAEAALDLLMCDVSNPRSVAFQLKSLTHNVEYLPREMNAPLTNEQKLTLQMFSSVQLVEVNEMCAWDEQGRRPKLSILLDQLLQEAPMLANRLGLNYFTHSKLPDEPSITFREEQL